jgi:hypothetical protein
MPNACLSSSCLRTDVDLGRVSAPSRNIAKWPFCFSFCKDDKNGRLQKKAPFQPFSPKPGSKTQSKSHKGGAGNFLTNFLQRDNVLLIFESAHLCTPKKLQPNF